MPYELWHSATQAQPSAQAFIFDGWSHEPLVIDRAPQAKNEHPRPEPATTDRKTVRSAG